MRWYGVVITAILGKTFYSKRETSATFAFFELLVKPPFAGILLMGQFPTKTTHEDILQITWECILGICCKNTTAETHVRK